MAICRECHIFFDDDSYRGRHVSRCLNCREKRQVRRIAVQSGQAEKHDRGNGKKPQALCPVCGEPRSVRALCLCERVMTPEEQDEDYARRFAC